MISLQFKLVISYRLRATHFFPNMSFYFLLTFVQSTDAKSTFPEFIESTIHNVHIAYSQIIPYNSNMLERGRTEKKYNMLYGTEKKNTKAISVVGRITAHTPKFVAK